MCRAGPRCALLATAAAIYSTKAKPHFTRMNCLDSLITATKLVPLDSLLVASIPRQGASDVKALERIPFRAHQESAVFGAPREHSLRATQSLFLATALFLPVFVVNSAPNLTLSRILP